MLLSAVLAVFLVAGTSSASMLNSKDPLWWQKNLSALGVPGDISGLAFNFTLIIAGALVTIIARYGTATLPFRTPHEVGGRTAVRFGLVLLVFSSRASVSSRSAGSPSCTTSQPWG